MENKDYSQFENLINKEKDIWIWGSINKKLITPEEQFIKIQQVLKEIELIKKGEIISKTLDEALDKL